MINSSLLKKYAKLAIETGVNVQKGQLLWINSPVECYEFTRLLVEAAYVAGAKDVEIGWSDNSIAKSGYLYKSEEDLSIIEDSQVRRRLEFVEKGCALISITSPVPEGLKGVDASKVGAYIKSLSKALEPVHDATMANRNQWCVIAVPNKTWASMVFPEDEENVAYEKLWKHILDASRVKEESDPIAEWEKHNESFAKRSKILNDYNFKSLYFKNSLGTDIEIGLVKNHIWCGGVDYSTQGIPFNANIPTEEIFTMPSKDNVNGKVYASKPLEYQGKLIKDFYFEFKNGKVVNYDAKEEKDALTSLLETDEGSKHIGEVALVPYDSPISNSNILFFNILFDENASCHLALGAAYPTNLAGGTEMSKEELSDAGANQSLNHVDFMFGTSDMEITGIKEDGTKVQIFKEGNFVF